jgi:hypothetical protein
VRFHCEKFQTEIGSERGIEVQKSQDLAARKVAVITSAWFMSQKAFKTKTRNDHCACNPAYAKKVSTTTQKGQKVEEEVRFCHRKPPMAEGVPWTQEMLAPPFRHYLRLPQSREPLSQLP